jgi:hypothetical protein
MGHGLFFWAFDSDFGGEFKVLEQQSKANAFGTPLHEHKDRPDTTWLDATQAVFLDQAEESKAFLGLIQQVR